MSDWLNKNLKKIIMVGVLVSGYATVTNLYFMNSSARDTEVSLQNMDENKVNSRIDLYSESSVYCAGWTIVALISLLIMKDSIKMNNATKTAALIFLSFGMTGCMKPFKPIKLEAIESHEVAFMIPYLQDGATQKTTNNEEFFKQKLVFAQQVTIPQQWVQRGYEFVGYNGEWRDAAVLIKVDTSPVTREWTADPDSGTSNRNEAIWVMTSDQVEFSTGWNVTARIKDKEDAVKFLANYPNGSLQKVLDQEVRAKLQTTFALQVTDLPMETLRKAATPIIEKTTHEVIDFFEQRGLTITNLGITGGFVYKDKTIMDVLVKVFNAEQDKAIAAAATATQEEKNKGVLLAATGKAEALLKEKEAEAKGIKLVAEAKFYELEKAKENLADYVSLKNLELAREMVEKWDGNFPQYYMGSQHPNTLLQLPSFQTKTPQTQQEAQ